MTDNKGTYHGQINSPFPHHFYMMIHSSKEQ